eukprot:TRINITY_DN1175_c0_g2_i1.p1 TRINITY_DN1175_c0_g2~~TRINITY_DN1175_c0_g2_i1.p1  ORF type:complete len:855 (-),score=212.00 TRINITY_DN1175_c0_g2_i1:231-2795(-)
MTLPATAAELADGQPLGPHGEIVTSGDEEDWKRPAGFARRSGRGRRSQEAAPAIVATTSLDLQKLLVESTMDPKHKKLYQAVSEKGDGSVLRGWRRVFDPDALLFVKCPDFCLAVQSLIQDEDVIEPFAGDNEITLMRFAPVQAAYLETFRNWVQYRFGGSLQMFSTFDEYNSGSITSKMFFECCYKYQCSLQEEQLSDVLAFMDGNEDNVLQPSEVVFLETDQEKRLQEIYLHKTQDQARTTNMRAKIYLENRNKKVHPKHRLAERPWHASTFEQLPTVMSVRQMERAKKIMGRQTRAKIFFLDYLCEQFGSAVKAWRRELDPDANFKVRLPRLRQFVRRADLPIDSGDLIKAIDKNDCGFCLIEDLCPESAIALCKFHKWACETFGSCAAVWDALQDPRLAAVQWASSKQVVIGAFSQSLIQLGWEAGRDAQVMRELSVALDMNGCGCVKREDLEWLDRWTPTEWLRSEPDDDAWRELRDLLLEKCGHPLKAWRSILDADGSNEVTWLEFQECCEEVGFEGDAGGAWRHLDSQLKGGISMREYDEDSSEMLQSFKLWADEVFGSVALAFQTLDEDSKGFVTLTEFRKGCRNFNWSGNPKLLFSCLKLNDAEGSAASKGLVAKDVVFLDTWTIPLTIEEERQVTRDTLAELARSKPKPMVTTFKKLMMGKRPKSKVMTWSRGVSGEASCRSEPTSPLTDEAWSAPEFESAPTSPMYQLAPSTWEEFPRAVSCGSNSKRGATESRASSRGGTLRGLFGDSSPGRTPSRSGPDRPLAGISSALLVSFSREDLPANRAAAAPRRPLCARSASSPSLEKGCRGPADASKPGSPQTQRTGAPLGSLFWAGSSVAGVAA